jgi:hypothetical protein
MPAIQNAAHLVDDPRGYLRAANVDTNAQQRWRCDPGPTATSCRPEIGQSSTLPLRPLRALSMIAFSALRLNIAIIGILLSTVCARSATSHSVRVGVPSKIKRFA